MSLAQETWNSAVNSKLETWDKAGLHKRLHPVDRRKKAEAEVAKENPELHSLFVENANLRGRMD